MFLWYSFDIFLLAGSRLRNSLNIHTRTPGSNGLVILTPQWPHYCRRPTKGVPSLVRIRFDRCPSMLLLYGIHLFTFFPQLFARHSCPLRTVHFSGGNCNDAYSHDIQQNATKTQNENCQNEVIAVRYQSDNHSLSSVLIPQALSDKEKSPLITRQVILIVTVAVVISVILSVTIMIVLLKTTNISFSKDPSNSEYSPGNELYCKSRNIGLQEKLANLALGQNKKNTLLSLKGSPAGYWLYCPDFDSHLFCY